MSAGEQVERLSSRLLGRRKPYLRVLTDADADCLRALCSRDPISHVFMLERLNSPTPLGRGGQLWGWFEGGELISAAWSGANFVLVEPTDAALDAFADRARAQGRRCMSIFGEAEGTLAFWERVGESSWGAPREVRPNQPLMALSGPPSVPADPLVRRAQLGDLDALLPACVAMFTEEVGYSPIASDGGWSYRARVELLVRGGRAFVRLDPTGRRVIFKAELGAVSDDVAQIQGVYVHPDDRGQGLAAPGMAAVVAAARRDVVPTASLYVNDFNTRAVSAYERTGFEQVGTFATVLF